MFLYAFISIYYTYPIQYMIYMWFISFRFSATQSSASSQPATIHPIQKSSTRYGGYGSEAVYLCRDSVSTIRGINSEIAYLFFLLLLVVLGSIRVLFFLWVSLEGRYATTWERFRSNWIINFRVSGKWEMASDIGHWKRFANLVVQRTCGDSWG